MAKTHANPKTAHKRRSAARIKKLGATAKKPAKQSRPSRPKTAKATQTKMPAIAGSDTKQALLIAQLRRKEGATIAVLTKATGWQSHSVRGAISGTLKKKLGLTVSSEKVEGRGRVYRIRDNL